MSTEKNALRQANDRLLRENYNLKKELERLCEGSVQKQLAICERALEHACKNIAACVPDCDWLSQSMYMNGHDSPHWHKMNAKIQLDQEAHIPPWDGD